MVKLIHKSSAGFLLGLLKGGMKAWAVLMLAAIVGVVAYAIVHPDNKFLEHAIGGSPIDENSQVIVRIWGVATLAIVAPMFLNHLCWFVHNPMLHHMIRALSLIIGMGAVAISLVGLVSIESFIKIVNAFTPSWAGQGMHVSGLLSMVMACAVVAAHGGPKFTSHVASYL